MSETISKAIKIAAYPISVIAGYKATSTKIRKEIYKNFAQFGIFENDKKLLKTDPILKGVADIEHGEKFNFPDLHAKVSEGFRAHVGSKFEKLGYHHIGDYWKALNKNQKTEAVVLGMTVTGILLGSMLYVADSKGLLEKLDRSERQKEAENPSK